MTRVQDILDALHIWAPPATAEPYDHVGLQVGDPDQPVHRILTALDLTPAVVDEAVAREVQLILTHHPLLFHPLRRLSPSEFVSGLAWRLVQHRIACCAAHTNLDSAPGGVSFALAERLGVTDLRPLHPTPGFEGHGLGVIGRLASPVTLEALLDRVCVSLDTPAVRYGGDPHHSVRTLAVCGGAGDGLITAAFQAGADAYVTSDLRYHAYFEPLDARGAPQMALVDAGHYETEALTETLLAEWLRTQFPDLDVQGTSHRTSPARMYVRGA